MPAPPEYQGRTNDSSVPPNAMPGDLMVAIFQYRDDWDPDNPYDEADQTSQSNPTMPGFTLLGRVQNSGYFQLCCTYLDCRETNTHNQVEVWWKRLTAADTGSYTISKGESQDSYSSPTIYHFKNVRDTGSPFDSTDIDSYYVHHPASGSDTSSTSGSTRSPSLSVTSNGPQRLLFHIGWASGTTTMPESFGFTQIPGQKAYTKVVDAGSSGSVYMDSTSNTPWGVALMAIASRDKIVTLGTSIATGARFGTAALQRGAVFILGGLIPTPAAPPTPTLSGRSTIIVGPPTAAPPAVPAPVLSAGAVTVGASSVVSSAAVASPTVRLRIGVPSAPTTEAVGEPAALIGDVTVPSIGSGERFGTLTLSPGAISLTVPSIASAQAFGTASVQLLIAPPAIGSVAAFGTAALLPGTATITVAAVPLTYAVPTPWLQTQVLRPDSVFTDFYQQFGDPHVRLSLVVDDGVPNDLYIQSNPELLLGTARIFPASIPTSSQVPAEFLLHLSIDPTARPGGSSIATALGVRYEVIVVARIPQQSGPPTLLTVDAIDWLNLQWTNILNRPQELELTCLIGGLTDPVVERLNNPTQLATELHVLRDGATVFAGPLMGGQTEGQRLTLTARGLMSYLRFMVITDRDLYYPPVSDQHLILKGMVDECQSRPYNHFGIDTFDVVYSGVQRKAFWKAKELHNVADRVEDLVDSDEQNNGFDVDIDPATRRLQCWTPRRGTDRSTGDGAVVFDARNITSNDVMFSVAPEDVASHVIGTGSDPEKTDVEFIAEAFNNQLLATFGRADFSEAWGSEAPDQATLQKFVNKELDSRDQALWVPGPNVRIDPDSDPGQYDVGDFVWYDSGGRIGVSGKFRVKQRTIEVDDAGRETGTLQFV